MRATFHNIGMSPSGKAPDFDSGIRRFKSGHPSQNDPLAQSVEHRPFKAGVLGSSPRRVTKNWRYPSGISSSLLKRWDSKARPEQREGKKQSGGLFLRAWESPRRVTRKQRYPFGYRCFLMPVGLERPAPAMPG